VEVHDTMPNETEVADRALDQVMQQVFAVLGINGEATKTKADEFWYQVALSLGVGIPEHGVLNMARQVLRSLDEEWDDDYASEDGSAPSLEAYETLYESAKAWKESREIEATTVASTDLEEAEDDTDDSIGPVDQKFESRAETTTTNIETTLNNIAKGQLILGPSWQRSFVWKLKKQRRLVESVLLGLPIPSLLLFRESASGLEYVIDGRQRLETISRFASGKPKHGEAARRFKTFPTSMEGWREGEKLNPAAGRFYEALPQEFKTKFDKAAIVIHTFVDLPRQKLYQIFKRYNTGAEHLKAAEIRNAVYQLSPLHAMMYRLAGEHQSDAKFSNEGERQCAATLRSIMRNKVARYGAYDFVGRYFAFSRENTGSVANATIAFMDEYETANVDELRDEFIDVFNVTCAWYEYPLITPEDGGKFHAFLATVQMVSTHHILSHFVKVGDRKEVAVKDAIRTHWRLFAEDTLQQKQNSTAFWTRQREWIALLQRALAASKS
jgi:hypothetical protein